MAKRDIIIYGSPSYLTRKGSWLPLELQKAYWMMNFSSDASFRRLYEKEVNSKVVKIGTIYIPLETGRYDGIYAYIHKENKPFVPIVIDNEDRKLVKFIPLERLGLRIVKNRKKKN